MTKATQDLAGKAILLLLIYFLAVKPLLEKMGVIQSPGTKLIEDETNNLESPFNPAFWRKYYYTKGAAANGRKPLNDAMIKKQKANAVFVFDAFGILADDRSKVISIFKGMKNQSEVSLLSDLFTQKYKVDILERLKRGRGFSPLDGLSNDDLLIILNYVKKLAPN